MNARGSFVDVYFDPYIPEMTGQDFKQILRPVLDFDSKSVEEAYLETVPPKAKEAIENHQVSGGDESRNGDVLERDVRRRKFARRRTRHEYEEWIYGEPPQDVEFVRFMGMRVRLETMKVDGTKLVKTDKEIGLDPVTKVAAAQDDEPSPPPLRHCGVLAKKRRRPVGHAHAGPGRATRSNPSPADRGHDRRAAFHHELRSPTCPSTWRSANGL